MPKLCVWYSVDMTLTSNDQLYIEATVERIVEQKLDERLEPIEKKIDRVIKILDSFAGNIQSHEQQLTMVEGHKDQLMDHEERITALEPHAIANA